MHRSGTSAFSRSTAAFGARFGDTLIGPREDNPKGFWEDSDIDKLHRGMLEELGVAWNRLTPLTREDLLKLEKEGFITRADALLRSKIKQGGLFAFKYPPMAKFYPFWSLVLARGGFHFRQLLAIRHPLSVARSLAKRDGLDKEYACLLFLAHVLPVLPGLQPGVSVVADYDRLISNPEREVRRIASHLHLEVNDQALHEYCSDFVSPGLRHTSYSVEDLNSQHDIDPLVGEVYRSLLDFAVDQRNLAEESAPKLFAQWNDGYEARVPLLGLIERVSAARDRQNILLRNAENELAWRDASLSWRLTNPLRSVATYLNQNSK